MGAGIRELLEPWVPGNLAIAEGRLRAMSPDLAAAELVALSRDGVSSVRSDGAHLAAEIFPDLGDEIALALMADPVSLVRWAACEKLYFNWCYRAAGPLAELLVREPETSVRNIAACALGHLGDERHLPHLEAALAVETGTDHEDRPIRDVIARAIQRIRFGPFLEEGDRPRPPRPAGE